MAETEKSSIGVGRVARGRGKSKPIAADKPARPGNLSVEIDSILQEIDRINLSIQSKNQEIEHLKSETREILNRLLAA